MAPPAKFSLVGSLSCLLIIAPFALQAQSSPLRMSHGVLIYPTLRHGMLMQEVVKLWGAASYKMEHETSRREFWQYVGAEVTFEEGKVSAWKTGVGGDVDPSAQQLASAIIVKSPMDEAKSREAEQLLSEIMREIPSESDSAQPSAPSYSGGQRGRTPADEPMEAPPALRPLGLEPGEIR